MLSDPSALRAGALLRYLHEHNIEPQLAAEPAVTGCVEALSIRIPAVSLERFALTLHDFCRRNDMQLVRRSHAANGAHIFLLSWIGARNRPEFMELQASAAEASSSALDGVAWWRNCRHALRQWRRPSGLFIACLGPDGSGKSSVISELCARPIAAFDASHTMELRPRLMRPVPVDPESRVPRGRLGTIAKLLMFVVDYWLGYWLRIRPKLVRCTLVVSDRYYDDILVDPRRYRMDRPRVFARVLLPWIPRPELWLVFDVPCEILQQRTTELAAEEATRQRGEYRSVLRRQEDVVVLDASQPLDDVIAEAERALVAQLARRTARQLGLPDQSLGNPATTNALLFFCRRRVPLLSRLVRVLFNSDIHCRLPPDVHMPHPYGIVIHRKAVIGRRVTVMQQVMIGGRDQSEDIAPVIGDDVHIGAGARVLGDVRIGNGVVIGANAVVTHDVPPGTTVVGVNRIVPSRSAGRPVTEAEAGNAASITQFPLARASTPRAAGGGVQRGPRSPP